MNVKLLASRLNVKDERCTRKAEELLRTLQIRFSGGLGREGEVCKTAICFELACRLFRVSINRSDVCKLSGSSVKMYEATYSRIVNSLKLKIPVSLRELTIQFGCTQILREVESVLNRYVELVTKSTPQLERRFLDFSSPAYASAAFSFTCKSKKVRVDRKKLLSATGAALLEYQQVLQHMENVLTADAENEDNDDGNGEQETPAEAEEVTATVTDTAEERSPANAKKSVRRVNSMEAEDSSTPDSESDFAEWKARLLSRVAKINDNAAGASPIDGEQPSPKKRKC